MSRVLLVEQDVLLAKQYSHKLASRHSVEHASSAQAAIEMLDKPDNRYDIIVMDVNIGGNNGVELLHELRSYDDWIDIPVVLLSSVPLVRLKHLNLDRYGVKKCMYKPMSSPADVLRHVGRVLA